MPEAFDDDQSPDVRNQKFFALLQQAQEQQYINRDLAIDLLEQALTLNPRADEALRLAGRLCQDAQRWSEAAQYFRRVLEESPNDCSAWIDLGFCLDPMGDLDGAYKAYTRASEVDESDAVGLNNRAYLEMGRGRLSEALVDVDAALLREPNEGIAHATKAEIFSQLGRYTEAFASLEKAIELEPEWLDTAENSEFLAGLRAQPTWELWIERIRASTQLD